MDPLETCRLCPATAGSLHQQLVRCFGQPIPGDPASVVKFSVAEVLNKHFWFELNRERDATAFVCLPCWHKVDLFHQFYQSVLVLYQSRCWLPLATAKSELEPDASIAVDQKLEITLRTEESEASDGDDDGGGGGDRDGAEDDIGVPDHLLHSDVEAAEDDEEEDEDDKPLKEVIKRPRGRPRKTKAAAAATAASAIKLEELSDMDANYSAAEDEQRRKSPEVAVDALLSQYFTLQCDLCSAPLPNLEVARNHHQQVHGQRGYMSCGCGQRFQRNAKMREHCAFHADPSLWKCAECCKIFTSAVRLASHRRLKHAAEEEAEEEGGAAKVGGGGEATAKKAATAASAGADGTAAEQRKREEDELIRKYMPMQCDVCSATYENFNEARRHHQRVHGRAGYMKCCGKQFLKKCKAVEHCHWHRNPKEFDCPTCSRNFNTAMALRSHTIRRHPSDVPFSYQCDQCESSFQLIGQLRYHQQRMHLPTEEKRFECYRCHRRYVFISQLRAHLRDAHQTGPSHVCDVCAKYFKSKATYELHYAVEHSNKPLKRQCPECGKWLKHAGTLWRHMYQHRSSPKTCADCGHVSPNHRALYMHRRRVHREAMHKCLVCGKMLKKLQTLREHMAIHVGITDLYTCSYCPKTFRSISNMYKHRRQVHTEQYEYDKRTAKVDADRRNTEEAAAAAADAAADAAAKLAARMLAAQL